MPQSTNLQLNLPYSYIGIGRSNNYVENFAIVSSTRYKENPNYKWLKKRKALILSDLND